MRRRLVLAYPILAFLLMARDPGGWSTSAIEHFLQTARIGKQEYAGKGLAKTLKATLTDGRREHRAHIQFIDVRMPHFKGKDGSEEDDFQDSWKCNVAAYRLAKLLHLADMVPVCVPRVVAGKPASVDWWIDGVMMDERQRLEDHISPPDVRVWNAQMDTIRVFDQLIYNMDRSQENLLITRDWRAWMIDHTRSFRKWHTLRNPAAITHCSADLMSSLRGLRRGELARETGQFLTDEQIDAVMARRDLIVAKCKPGL